MDFTIIPASWAPRLLSILRIITGLLFLEHSTAKLFKFPPLPMFANLDLMTLVGVAGVIELVGSILLILGVFSRPVAFILSGEMAVAYFMAHAPRSFYPLINGGEAAILFCFIFLYIAAAGPGPWSIDAARRR
ncbi:DoxX family protein [Reyranella sp.]|jgi:putative oxidoreductase|uniref:DoxX family protein n=1 Tax=Reyranella sp. TaxID=1929291 RepID=UPI002F958F68